MVKVLVANKSKEATVSCCKFLTKEKLKVFGVNTGINALEAYNDICPDIFVLSKNLTDINGIEVLNRISLKIEEKKKCNTIFTVNDSNTITGLENTAKIYKILYKPTNKKILETIYEIYRENMLEQLDMQELDEYLSILGFHCFSQGAIFMKTAIQLCFYYPKYLDSLDCVLEYIANEYNTTAKAVRYALRASLKPLNKLLIYDDLPAMYKLFNKNIDITPKIFIEKSVIYFKSKKRNK